MSDRASRLALGAVLMLALFAWGSRQYVVPDPWNPYYHAVRDYLAAGLRNDSAALRRDAAASQPAVWVRDAARREPTRLASWFRDLSGVAGERHGDTVAVVLSADENLAWQRRPGEAAPAGCVGSNSVAALLINHSLTPRLLALSSPCLDPSPLQVLRNRSALLP
ncbi:MAG TPA: hypothetical protein VHR43_11495 [Gemmatimonadales bacterium]|nr:hypothetical protein [Gemmatimonadales bacterium]